MTAQLVTPVGAALGRLSRWACSSLMSDGFLAHMGTDPEYVRTLNWDRPGLRWMAEVGPRRLIKPDETSGERRKELRSCIA